MLFFVNFDAQDAEKPRALSLPPSLCRVHDESDVDGYRDDDDDDGGRTGDSFGKKESRGRIRVKQRPLISRSIDD